MGDAKRLAVFRASSKTFSWVTGLPPVEEIGSFGSTPMAEDGKIYLPVVTVTEGAQPSIYAIDAKTAVATKGLVVTCTGIGAVGKLIPAS